MAWQWIEADKRTALMGEVEDGKESERIEELFGKKPEPSWFEYRNWDSAVIDFSDIAQRLDPEAGPVSVELHDPTTSALQDIDNAKPAQQFAMSCAAYIKSIDDPGTGLFPDLGADGWDGLLKRKKASEFHGLFAAKLKSHIARRISDGIFLFMNKDTGDLGNA